MYTERKSYFQMLKEVFPLKKKKDKESIRSNAAEYLTYVASVGDQWSYVKI